MTYNRAMKTALSTLSVPHYHNVSRGKDAEYIVWSEAGTGGLIADGRIKNRSQRVAVDFFTKTEYSPVPLQIQVALEEVGFAVDPNIAHDYEEDTGYEHHALTAEWKL